MGARMPEKDQDGFVITEITPDREAGAEGESAGPKSLRTGLSKQFCHLEAKQR